MEASIRAHNKPCLSPTHPPPTKPLDPDLRPPGTSPCPAVHFGPHGPTSPCRCRRQLFQEQVPRLPVGSKSSRSQDSWVILSFMALHTLIPLVYCCTSLNPQAESFCLSPHPSANPEQPFIRKCPSELPTTTCWHHPNSFPYQPCLTPFQIPSLLFPVVWELHFCLLLTCTQAFWEDYKDK